MKKSTKLLALLLVLVMAIGMLSACGKTEDKKDTTSNTQTTTDNTTSTDETDDAGDTTDEVVDEGPFFPLAETETFTTWCIDNRTLSPGYSESVTAKVMEELTNVKLEVSWVTSNESQEKFGLMIASGDIPDMVNSGVNSYYTGGSVQAVADGLFLETTDLVAQYMPNYAAILEANPNIRKDITADDGKMYSIWGFLAELNTQEVMTGKFPIGPAIRKDMLDDLGLDMPVTIDDWTEVLTAFKDAGVECPLRIGSNGKLTYSPFLSAYGVLDGFYVDNGAVKFGPAQEGYKEYCQQMREWYEAGLIDQNFSSYSGYLDLGHMADDSTGAGVIFWIFGADEMKAVGFPVEEDFWWENTSFPVLNEGDTAYAGAVPSALDTELCINAEVEGERLETLCKYLDFMYTSEAFYARNLGEEGNTYYFKEDGTVEYTDMMYNDPEFNITQMGINTSCCEATTGLRASNSIVSYAAEPMQATWKAADTSLVYPSRATMNNDELLEYNTLYTNISTLVDEMTVKFIMGTASLDEFDNFVEQMYSYGLQDCIDYKQAALDRYNAR